MPPDKICSTYSLEFCTFNLKNAFDRHLYISSATDLSLSILCYDGVLCYISNIIGQGTLTEIEENLKRYFSFEQMNQAYFNLHNCLDYSLSILDSNKDHFVHSSLQQCSINLIDSTTILLTMEAIHINHLFSYLPIFVTHDWLHMIRSVQNLEQFDITSSSFSNVQQQMLHLKEHLTSLHNMITDFNHMSSTVQSSLNDQCCLRTSCTHNPSIYRPIITMDSPPSSWSSLDIDTNPIKTTSGFIRNPVTNFIMPTSPALSEMESSMISFDDTMSSEEEQEALSSSFSFARSFSHQPSISRIGGMVVRRDDVLWMYPAAVIKQKFNSLFSSVHESTDQCDFKPLFTRANSCDIDFPNKKLQNSLPNIMNMKPKKTPIKQTKGLNRI